MPTRDSIMQVPFVGGIDEYADPDQLQPPSMAAMTNCVVRKPGRIEKRAGFKLVSMVGSGLAPATVFGGTLTSLPRLGEAVGTQQSQDGDRLIVAAGNTMFEYVGSDATHGYREVNRIPCCYGTLHAVDATGGEIIEVESMINDAGTMRCTAWVLGTRNGQDLTNDTAIHSQSTTTYGVYVSVQRVSDGSFVTPPQRVTDSFGADTAGCYDLRMALSKGELNGSRHWVIAFRRQDVVVEAFVVNADDGYVKPTSTIVTPFAGRKYWRAFDLTGVTSTTYMLLATCDNDTTPGSSDVGLKLIRFNDSTGVFTTVYAAATGVLADALAFGTSTYGIYNWARYTPRGVVLENDPSGTSVSVAIRTLHQANVAPFYIDGKFVVLTIDCASSVTSVKPNKFGWMHQAGFKTQDDFGQFSTAVGYQSKNSALASATAFSLSPTTYSPANSSVTAIITAQFADGTFQPYSVKKLAQGTTSAIYENPTVFRGSQSNTTILASQKYPSPFHAYPPDNIVDVTQPNNVATTSIEVASVQQANITRAQLGGAPGVVGFFGSVQYCKLLSGANERGFAIIAFDALGVPTEIDLYDGRGSGNVLGAPALSTITQIQTRALPYTGAWGAPVAVPANTIEVYDDFNAPAGILATATMFTDLGMNNQTVSQAVVETNVGIEQCVQRWDVANTGTQVILAVSSTSAATFSGPNGDPPLGYVSPFGRSSYFEVYGYTSGTNRYDLNSYTTTTSPVVARALWCAMGGPWRMIGGLVKLDYLNRYACVLMPAGDDFQQSAFMVSFVNGSATVETTLLSTDKTTVMTAENVVYKNNQGVFVESLNMARTAAAPLNCPRFSKFTNVYGELDTLSCGALRQGQNAGGTEVFAIDYTLVAKKWRVIKPFGDYAVINGGVVSSFDGSSCNEVSMLLWPQRDLTSIAYPEDPSLLFTTQSTTQYAIDAMMSAYLLYGSGGPYLANIKRPWFAYEAGFKDKNEYDVLTGAQSDMNWGSATTEWGGDPTKDYQSVYADPRLLQITGSRYNSGAGLTQDGAGHYYGRYQTGYSITKTIAGSPIKTVIWAPRTALDESSVLNNVYNPLVANGDFLVRWCYEAVDGTGRVIRSAPSQAVTFSICSNIKFTERVFGGSVLPDPQVTVHEYRYGFFAPRLELTNRQKTAASDSKRVVLQPYFTAEPFATVFYRAPFSNFLPAYKNDFTISRNATRGVVPYSTVNGGALGVNPRGLVTNNFRCFDGPAGDYNGLLAQPFLYTTGGVLDNVPPPSALCMTVHQNRLVLGGADDATVIWYSKELGPTDAPAFNDALTIQIEDGGPVTGLASMESMLVVFKKNMTFIVPGEMPDDTGSAINRGYVSNTLGTPVRMPHGIGCIAHRSIIETPIGVFFQSERTLELLSRDMNVTPIGLQMTETLAGKAITGAAHNAKDNEVWFCIEPATAVEQPTYIVYNYFAKTWSKHLMANFGGAVRTQAPGSITIVDGTPYVMAQFVPTSETVIFKQNDSAFFDSLPTYGSQYVTMSWTTAPLSMNQVQGYQRTKRIRVFGSPIPATSTGAPQVRDPHGASFTLQTDYATTGANMGLQTASWTESETAATYTDQNREVYEVHVAEQKGQKLTLSYQEAIPASLVGMQHGYGTAFSNMALVVGLKSGLDKRITSGAKH